MGKGTLGQHFLLSHSSTGHFDPGASVFQAMGCRLAVHKLSKRQVGRDRQHPPTMSQITSSGQIISVNTITRLCMKSCLCPHQYCQLLHPKVGRVTRVGGRGMVTGSDGSRPAVPMLLKALSWSQYI